MMRREEPCYDIEDLGPLDGTRLQSEIAHGLRLKGFSVLRLGTSSSHLEEATDQALDLKRSMHFETPASQILDGLLGPQGTREYCRVEEPSITGEAMDIGASLKVLMNDFSGFSGHAAASMKILGFPQCAKTATLLVRGGDITGEDIELTEEACLKWLNTISRSKLMLIYFLGEGLGTLELQPFDQESDSVEITTEPGMMVILRADLMTHLHRSTNNEYSLVCFLTSNDFAGSRGLNPLDSDLMPAMRELQEWRKHRLQELIGSVEDKFQEAPRDWQLLARQNYLQQGHNPVAVRGTGGHMPGAHSNDTWWKSLSTGIDYVQQVPISRWDHSSYYDPDPNCYLKSSTFRPGGVTKTSICHGQFIDGIDMFDAKFFSLSNMEAKGMDPMQRHILETSYEALFEAGYTKKTLANAYIAVFTGCTNPEWNYIDKEAGACSGTGSSQAITSNRTSFALGMMGPSTSIDVEMASAGMALMLGATAVSPNNARRTESGGDSEAAVVGGVYLSMTPYMWPRFNAWMNPRGRCFTFDQNANGYVRGECCASAVLKPYFENVNGQLVQPDAAVSGTIVGWRMTNNGRSAGLMAPSGPAEQEAIYDAVRHARLSPLDLDAFECHGAASLLGDSVEVSSAAAVLRGMPGGELETLVLSSVKTNVGAQCEASCMSSFIKVLYNMMYSVNLPTVHLRAINPHIDIGDGAVVMISEALPYRCNRAFHGVSSRGMGGTNVNLVCWGMAERSRVPTAEKSGATLQALPYWPGGGGLLDIEEKPLEGYFIAGSWNGWVPEEMERDRGGHMTYTLTLGENRFEVFQIWLDGERTQVLHPERQKAPPGSSVCGPTPYAANSWLIDARVRDEASAWARDAGVPGDEYEVKLLISGKYRALTWKRLAPESGRALSGSRVLPLATVAGKYYVTGSMNGWGFVEMTASREVPGLFFADVGPIRGSADFQIIRNKDEQQVFYPVKAGSESGVDGVLGPDFADQRLSWRVSATYGSYVRIEFRRTVTGSSDERSLSWAAR